MATTPEPARCSIQRAADVIGDRWTLLILREAMFGRTRFTEFRTNLGIAPDILSARLAHLVEQGLLRREEYRQPGFRGRLEYRLTPDGLALHPLIAALGEWGENARPVAGGTSPRFAVASTGTPVRLAFVTEDGEVINPRDIAVERGVPSAAG